MNASDYGPDRPIYPRHPSDKPAPGTTVRIGDPGWSDPDLKNWPEWDHPLGGPGRWAVVLRSLRKGVEACPLVEGVTLSPRPLNLPLISIYGHRTKAHEIWEKECFAKKLQGMSGLYSEVAPSPPYPAWLQRPVPTVEHVVEQEQAECLGHPPGSRRGADPGGQTVYCDGSCRSTRAATTAP